MVYFCRSNKIFFILMAVVLTMPPRNRTLASPLIFTSADNLLVAHRSEIYQVDVSAQTACSYIALPPELTTDAIAYNHKEKALWITTRHGIPEGGYFNNLLIIPEDRAVNPTAWRSDIYWPRWNNCAQIYLAPHGNRIATIKAHEQSRTGDVEPRFGCDYAQQLAVLPPDRDPAHELPFEIHDDDLCTDPFALQHAEISDDAANVLITTYKGKVFWWNPTTQTTTPLNSYLGGYLNFGALSSDGRWAFISTTQKGLLLFNGPGPCIKPAMLFGRDAPVLITGHIDQAVFSENNNYLFILSHEPHDYQNSTLFSMLVFNLETRSVERALLYTFVTQESKIKHDACIEEKIPQDFGFGRPFASCAISPDGKTIAALSNRGRLRIINTETETAMVQQLPQDVVS